MGNVWLKDYSYELLSAMHMLRYNMSYDVVRPDNTKSIRSFDH
jgi:hypothetical protein